MRTLLLLPVLLVLLPLGAVAQDAKEVFREVERRQNLVKNEEAAIRMDIIDERGRTRSRSMTVYTKVGADDRAKSLVVFTAPADIRGMGLLTIETARGDDQKLYLPALGRVQRIAGSRRTERFAGSDFTYEDLGTRDPDAYTSRMLETRPNAFVLEVIPQDRDSQYGRIVLTVDRARYAILQADYFDRAGQKVKSLTAEGLTEVAPGAFRPATMTMRDLKDNRRTVLTFTERKTDRVLPDDLFTERQLERGGR
jgi:outer membrane lipoprotein-sorting protein